MLAVILAGWFFFGASMRVVEREYRDLLRETSAMLVSSAVLWLRGPDTGIDASIDSVSSGLDVRVTLISTEGRVLGDSQRSGSDLHAMETHLTRPEVVRALGGEMGFDTRLSATLGTWFLYSAQPVVDEGVTLAILRLAVPLNYVAEIKALRLRYIVSGCAAVLAASLLLGAVLNTWFLRPILRLQNSATAIAQGDLYAPIGELGSHEIGELGRTVQRLADALRQNIRRLEAERSMQEAVFASLREGVIALNRQGFVIFSNEAARTLLGEASEIIGRDVFDFFRQPSVTSVLTELIERGHSGECEITLGAPAERVVRLSAVHVAESPAELTGLLVLTDITSQVATLRMRRDFFSNASHELRTPLTSILGYLEALEDHLPEDSPLRAQYVEVLQRQAQRMRSIIDDLLLLARVESDQWPVQKERYDLAGQAATLLESFEPAARKNEQVLALAAAAQPLWVLADREKIQVVLSNLLDNAIKYSGPGARVELRLSPSNAHVEVTVQDNGPGIPRDQKYRIFERFYRVDKSRSQKLGGTGLGLSIVRHLLAAHDVDIEVESDVGKGASFRFRLPLSAPMAA